MSDLLRCKSAETCPSLASNLVCVPLEIHNNGTKENAVFVSGIAGVKVDNSNDIPAVEARHGWALFVNKESNLGYQNHLVISRVNSK